MIGALAYLVTRTVRNRIVRQVARLKSPRYAIATLAGLAYVWFFFLRHVGSSPRGGAGDAAAAAAAATLTATMGTLASVVLLIGLVFWWLRGGVAGALAFQPAEVHFLFAAPLSRRALIGYKFARGQLLMVVNALVWLVLMRTWGLTLAAPMLFATVWAFFTVIGLHRLGAALVQTPPVRGGRKLALTAARGLAVALAATFVAGVFPVLRQTGSADFEQVVRALGRALDAPPAAYALAPFRLLVAPMFAPDANAWARAFAIVLGIVAVHVAWVFSMRVQFEEAAAAASTALAKRIAAFRQSRSGIAPVTGATRVKRDWLPLAPLGRPAVAVVWKNTLALARTGGLRAAVFLVVMLAVMTTAISGMDRKGAAGAAGLLPLGVFFVMSLVMGPRALRNDLRQDLLSLSLLKSYPLRGAQIVAAELASPTLALTAVQFAMIVMGIVALPAGLRARAGGIQLVMIVVLSPLVLGALNATSIAINNGAALMFPAWVRLGPDSGGIEAIGQNLLFVFGALLALVLALVLPAIAGAAAIALAGFVARDVALAAGLVAASAVLFGEVAWMVARLGRLFERTEPSALV